MARSWTISGIGDQTRAAALAAIVARSLLALLVVPGAPIGLPAAAIAAEDKILVVTGELGQPRDFTLDELEALGTVELTTTTPFTEGEIRFTGVPLKRLLEAVEARGELVHATALDDYKVDIPREDAEQHGALLATRAEGEPLPTQDKGPVWIVYPWSQHPELDKPAYASRSIWQVRSLEVR